MTYESGMQLIWDPIEKSITIIFRGAVEALPGPFHNREEGISAAEAHCRTLGWSG